MAETVTLQWYLKNLNDMLERESPTEVISHCRYILQRFPKNVETYRLLGKALLQKGHSEEVQTSFNEAEEVFLRVLSVLPGDYIAHLGMSEIREQTRMLDQAIWHMERAYEQMPGNTMLQEGLRQLYTKRTGGGQAATKIQLTRGGLARQYLQAHLYEQALTELRDALDQSPQRVDLEVLLAETLWESQHPVEAGEVAVQILKKLPNCLSALRILAQLWLDYERPTDAQVYLEQIEALDPYEAVRIVHPGENVPDAIRLPRLDYSAKSAAALSSETPDWVEELGDISDIQDVFQPPAAAFTPPVTPVPSAEPERIDTDAIFGMPLGNEEVPDWYGGQAFPELRGTEEGPAAPEIPDWFADVVSGGPPTPTDTSSVEADWLALDDDLFAQAGTPQAEPQPESSSVEADWLAFDDALFASEEQSVESPVPAEPQPASPSVEADWLAFDDALFASEEQSVESPVPAEPQPESSLAEADWLAFDDALFASEEQSVESPAEPQPESPLAEADWLAFDDALFASEEQPVEPPAPAEPQPESPSVEADWLGFDDALFASEEQSAGPSAPAEPQPESPSVEADWLAFEDESFVLEEQPSQDEPSPERLSSGFTDLLQGIERSQVVSDEFDAQLDDIEPVPPDWLLSFEESEKAESPLPEPDMMAWFSDEQSNEVVIEEPENPEITGETFSWDASGSFASEQSPADAPSSDADILSSEEAELAWLSEQPEQVTPEALDALLRASMPPEDLSEFFDDEEVPESQSEPEMPESPQDVGQAEAWLAEFEAFDDAELGAAAEAPVEETSIAEALAEDWLAGVEAFDDAEFGAALVAAEAPAEAPAEDWLADAEALDDAEFDTVLASSEGTSELPDWVKAAAPLEDQRDELPSDAVQIEGDLLSFFDMQQEEALEQPDQAVSEPEPTDVLGWLAPEPEQDDWLASFVKPGSEVIESEIQEQPVPEANTWDSEPASYEVMSFDAEEEISLGAVEFEDAAEIQGPELPIETIEVGPETIEIEEAEPAASWLPPSEAPVSDEIDDESPTWLSELEPISAPPLDETTVSIEETYDPFSAGRDDQTPAYESAIQTGILQPFEEPDWMAAFSDEEMPTEPEPEEAISMDFLGMGFEGDKEPEPTVTESLADLEFEAWDHAEEDLPETNENAFETSLASDDEGVMPDWLAAITSEAEKLDEAFFEETAESYGSVEETGVLQPGSTPDWLIELEPEQESAAAEELPFEIEESGAQLEFPAGVPEIDDFFLPETDTPDQFGSFGFEIDAVEAHVSEVRDEVAQPDDLAHTSAAVWEEETTEDWDEPVPEDFSFDDQQPAWLRSPKERDSNSHQTNYGDSPEAPEWLRDVFEEDDQ